jgi:hypothetical protein
MATAVIAALSSPRGSCILPNLNPTRMKCRTSSAVSDPLQARGRTVRRLPATCASNVSSQCSADISSLLPYSRYPSLLDHGGALYGQFESPANVFTCLLVSSVDVTSSPLPYQHDVHLQRWMIAFLPALSQQHRKIIMHIPAKSTTMPSKGCNNAWSKLFCSHTAHGL